MATTNTRRDVGAKILASILKDLNSLSNKDLDLLIKTSEIIIYDREHYNLDPEMVDAILGNDEGYW